MKLNLKNIRNYCYLLILLCFSGNPIFYIPEASKTALIIATILLIIMHFRKLLVPESKYLYIFLVFFSIIFTIQYQVLGFVSMSGALGFLSKLAFGYIIIAMIGTNFRRIYFNIIYFISFISLVGYIWNLAGLDIPFVYNIEDRLKSLIFYTQRGDGLRNSGMFWEPGAFACYINLSFLFYIRNINELLSIHKIKIIIVLIALVTTFSTTGYIVFFLLIVIALFQFLSLKNTIFFIPLIVLFVFGSIKIYKNSSFLKEKITNQLDEAISLQGEFSSDRFGALLFDIYYIKKHPIIGNGLHEKTRYADHPFLHGEKLGHGNGFSNFLASMGFLSLMFYSYWILKFRIQYKWIFLLILLLILQGEPLMNFPLFLTIPFIFLFDENDRISDDMPQQA